MSPPPAMTYLTKMTTEQAEDLLIALEALREWIWEIHGDRIAPDGDEDPFANCDSDPPDFLTDDF